MIYTIGHSTRGIEEFISILKANRIEALVDVRAFPSSQRNPHFGRDALQASLNQNGIEYIWLGRELGGYRRKKEGLGESSPNKGWEKGGFRLYADYMLSDKFKTAAAKLVELANERKVAYMCAEKFYWRCHRQLISDYLLTQGIEVWHIVEADKLKKHEKSKLAKIKGGTLTYPPKQSSSEASSLIPK